MTNTTEAALNGTYNLFLVGLSILVAMLASYTALDLAGRITAASGRARLVWLAGGSLVMGIGIWSTYFLGILAFSIPLPMTYDLVTVLASMAVAIAASALALFVVSRPSMGAAQLAGGGFLMAIGILGTHYVGMEGLRLQASLSYDPVLVVLSGVVALVAALAALWLAYQLRREPATQAKWLALKIGSALFLGAAISGMHYTGMAAATFRPSEKLADAPPQSAQIDTSPLAVGVATTTFLILGAAIFTAILNRRFKDQE
ncbi:hypothetical protein BH23ACT11_BH23ACT11_01720 [soil metagenome]